MEKKIFEKPDLKVVEMKLAGVTCGSQCWTECSYVGYQGCGDE